MDIIRVLIADPGMIVCEMQDGSVVKRSEGTVAWRCNNPGNLKFGPFAKQYGAISHDHGGHAVFPNLEMGTYAHSQLLFSPDSRYYNLTLIDAIKRYAPESDGNNPWAYQRYITNKTGVGPSRLLRTLNAEEREGMLACMRLFEGYKVGVISVYPEDFQQEELADENTETDEDVGPIETTKAAKKKARKRSSKKQASTEQPIKDYWSDDDTNTA